MKISLNKMDIKIESIKERERERDEYSYNPPILTDVY